MTSFLSSSNSAEDIPVCILQHLKCSICMEVLKEPVTTVCGHTFCNTCLVRHMNSSSACPLCTQHLSSVPKVNIVFINILKELHEAQGPSQELFTLQMGEIACDICPDRHKCKAVKSCLICLLSYCSEHLQRQHNKPRTKGHKLVPPLNELDERACKDHGRPLELYSFSEGRLICSLCVKDGTNVVSVEEERGRRQAQLDIDISEKRQRIQQREDKIKELNFSVTNCLALIAQEAEEIKKVFSDIKKAVQMAEDEMLSPLKDRLRQLKQEVKDLKGDLKEEITSLTNKISNLRKLRDHEDPVFFLQNHSSDSVDNNDTDMISVFLDTDLSFGTIRSTGVTMMAKIKDKFEKLSRIEIARIKKFKVDVTLDPNTANAQLLISDDMREVQNSAEKMEAPDCPEKFDMFGSILGQNWLTEGRTFWVVEVGDKQGWDIGVAREDANRKGALSLKPDQGYWAIVHYNGDNYAALEDSPTLLSLLNKPRKVGVYVDYEEALVSFYDMEAETHIYSFTNCSFGEVIRPYFSPHLNQDGPLVICRVNPSVFEQL